MHLVASYDGAQLVSMCSGIGPRFERNVALTPTFFAYLKAKSVMSSLTLQFMSPWMASRPGGMRRKERKRRKMPA